MFDDRSGSHNADLLVNGFAAVDQDQGRDSPDAVARRRLAAHPTHHIQPDDLSFPV